MKVDRKRLLSALDRIAEVKAAVAGDLIADVYVYARPVTISREAPVLVTREERRETLPGGAANAANNIVALTGSVSCVGVVGRDPAGACLKRFFDGHGHGASTIVRVPGAATYTKTRFLAGDVHTVKQQVFRVDNAPADRMSVSVEGKVLAAIDRAARVARAWLVSDYDGDLFTERVIRRLNGLAAGRCVVVDSHSRLSRFKSATCMTPNEAEAEAQSGIAITDDKSAVAAGRAIRKRTGSKHVFVTRGNRGMTVVGPGRLVAHLPIVGPREIVDVAGAGDTVAVVVMLALASGQDAVTAGLLASYAASVVCMRTGVATATLEDIRAAIEEYPLPKL